MSRRLSFAVVAAVAFAACSDPSGPTPSAPADKPDAAIFATAGCPNDVTIIKQIAALFPKGQGLEAIAEIKFLAIRLAITLRKPATAQTLAYNLTDWTLQLYNQGKLVGGKSVANGARVSALISAVYCVAGLPDPAIPAAALGNDGAAAVILPTSPTTTIVTPTLTAGITIAGGSVTVPTIITVTRLPDDRRLLTPLDQYPLYYQFTATPALTFGSNAVVGVCIASSLNPPDLSRLRVAHNVPDPLPTTIEILPLAPAPFLNCTNAALALGPNPSLREFAAWGLSVVGNQLAKLVTPEPLYAMFGATGLGGTTRKLSPFGVVDTLLMLDAVSTTALTGTAGSSVASSDLPSVRLHTPTNVPVTNYPVTFRVPTGSQGTITGSAATTDANGVATVGSWTLGTALMSDSVFAAAAAPHLNSGVQPFTVLFQDNVTSATVLSYQATGYRYLTIGNDAAPSSWETGGYSDASWSQGSAAFGSGPGSPNNCSLDQTVQSLWPAASVAPVSDILVRRSVVIPNGFTGSLQISVAVDNDLQIFVNGYDITPSGGQPLPAAGFYTHEGCATLGSAVFTAPASVLLPGQPNLIAVHARDRAGTSYFDMAATLAP
ncbi:MAG: hypothetical protein ABJC74_00310 [Gemmatimonadota bacterium]